MNSRATLFEFVSYEWQPEQKRAVFHYKTKREDGEVLNWTETILLPSKPTVNPPQKLLESLHIMLAISYWKFHCAPDIHLPYKLSKQEAEFWNTVYKKGLGEFFYRNNLDPVLSPKFPFREVTSNEKPATSNLRVTSYQLPVTNRCLVGIGGGKDSIVTAELLKKGGFNISAFVVETNKQSPLISKIIEVMEVGDVKIQRILDEKVFDRHPYNGHVPISAVYAFLGLLAGVLYGYSYIVVGNEYSSNFGNIRYKGLDINHQWSKSFEFEKLFQKYVKNYITPDIFYFSLLRPFYEIRIAKLFSQVGKKYFQHFSSCNRNFSSTQKMDRGLWCLECPKCVFTFTLLSAFLLKKELISIFGKNLYQEERLLPLFKNILGLGEMKPFDCVGTFEEAQTALVMAQGKFKNDFIIKELLSKVKTSKEVFETQKENALPEEFKLLGIESALIAGYGKEGIVTKKYLKKFYPHVKIGIADSKFKKSRSLSDRGSSIKYFSNILSGQENFDVAIKTPGIKKELIKIPYTTATNIFFSKIKGKNLIIGVTGSKGKSTTSSLIYHILKTAGKKVELLGNIGKPMLERLQKPVSKDTIFVLELSSYQLDDIHFSPDIAVVTNLFPEHMDYHGSKETYYAAKKNIINYQKSTDYFVHNKVTKHWLKGYQGKAVPFSQEKFKSNLLGEHNQSNIGAAVAVAQILKIKKPIITKAVATFKALPNRLEHIGNFQGIQFYNDGSSTNPESAILAIKALKNVDTIFLGGQERGYNFSQLEKTIKTYKIKNIVLFPDNGKKMIKSKKDFNILFTDSMKKAVEFAYAHTKRGKICLLSGGSPSYSLWENFDEKGQEFKKWVKKLSS